MTLVPSRAHPLFLLLMAATITSMSGGANASSQDDFEAALRATPAPAARSTASSSAPAANGGRRRPLGRIAAPGTVPPRFRAMSRYGTETEAAIREAVQAGELDPFAMMDQLAGALPIPPGAFPLRCETEANYLQYSLGVEASPEYMRVRAAFLEEQRGPTVPPVRMVNGQMVPSATVEYMGRRSQLAASPSTVAAKTRAQAFLISAGFVRSSGDTAGREIYRPGRGWRGATPINIVFSDDAMGIGDRCAERGITIPWGPVITVSYDPGF